MDSKVCNCKNCSELDSQSFFEHEVLLIREFDDSIDIETSSDSYLLFLLTASKMTSKIEELIYSTILEMKRTNINFSTNVYFDLDRLINHYKSLYHKMLLYIRSNLLREEPCPNFGNVLRYMATDYYLAIEPHYKLSFKDDIRDYFMNKFKEVKCPISNGDFAKVAEEIGYLFLDYFKLIIIQYAQSEIIKNKYKTVLYTPDFQYLSEELEYKLIKNRIEEISEYSDTVYFKSIKSINYIKVKRLRNILDKLSNYNIIEEGF